MEYKTDCKLPTRAPVGALLDKFSAALGDKITGIRTEMDGRVIITYNDDCTADDISTAVQIVSTHDFTQMNSDETKERQAKQEFQSFIAALKRGDTINMSDLANAIVYLAERFK